MAWGAWSILSAPRGVLLEWFLVPGRVYDTLRMNSETDGRILYAIGDIHGCLEHLDRLLDKIHADLEASQPVQKPKLIFLGDYIDRGPKSRGVVDRLLDLQASARFELTLLKGNHEAALLRFLDDPAFGAQWASFGALATLASYSVASPRLLSKAEAWDETRRQLIVNLPPLHLDFYRRLQLYEAVGSYIFVHAGLRPGLPIAAQTEDDLIGIRDTFVNSTARHEKIVVHGHTVAERPVNTAFRIGIDTGAYATGRLTAVKLEGSTRSFID